MQFALWLVVLVAAVVASNDGSENQKERRLPAEERQVVLDRLEKKSREIAPCVPPETPPENTSKYINC